MSRSRLALTGLWVTVSLTACGDAASERSAGDAAAVGDERPPVEVRAAVDRAVATTGDLITYRVTVDRDPAYEVELPEPGAEIAGFRIVDLGAEEPRELRGRSIEERWYRLRADLVGSYVLPPVRIAFRPSGDDAAEPEVLETSPIFVEVESVLAASGEPAEDIRGLKPLRSIDRRLAWLPFALGALVLALAAVGVILWRRRPRRSPPAVPPHELAFESLRQLRREDLSTAEAVRRFHFSLSEIVRSYVEGRYGLNATDLTTEEILGRLNELAGLEAEPAVTLRRFLEATDRVKFADHLASEPEIAAAYEGALTFVEGTLPRVEEEPDETVREVAA